MMGIPSRCRGRAWGFGRTVVATRTKPKTMSDEAKPPTGASPPATWTVTGIQTAATDDGRSRVEVVIRGRVEGVVDRGGG